jgi:hypothetical protein
MKLNISVHYIYISNLFMQHVTETVLSQDNNKVTFFKFVVSMVHGKFMLITYNVMNKYIQQIFNIFTVLFLKVHVL